MITRKEIRELNQQGVTVVQIAERYGLDYEYILEAIDIAKNEPNEDLDLEIDLEIDLPKTIIPRLSRTNKAEINQMILEQREAGKSLKEIGDMIGITKQSVAARLKKLNL